MAAVSTATQTDRRVVTRYDWPEVYGRITDVVHQLQLRPTRSDGLKLCVYGVPRGGTIVAGVLCSLHPGRFTFWVVPETADVIIDDIVDSGATRRHHLAEYPSATFVTLFDKTSVEADRCAGWMVMPWEPDKVDEDNERHVVRLLELIGEDAGREGLLDTPKEKLLVPKVIMPMAIPDGSVARAGYPVYVGEKLVGTVTSGTMIPYWKMEGTGLKSKPGTESSMRAICLVYLDADLKKGQRTKVAIRNKVADGVIVNRHMGSEAPPYARPLLIEE